MQLFQNSPEKFRALLAAVAVTLLSFLIAITVKNANSSPLDETLRLSTNGSGDVRVAGNYIYYKEGSSLHCVNSGGSFVWNMSVDSNASFDVSKFGIAVWSYRKFQIVDSATGVSKISTSFDSDILSARIGDSYAAIVLGPEENANIVLTDLQGNTVDTIKGLKELTVLDYGFFEGQKLFWLMTLDSTGSLPTCTVATYKPGRSETGNITDMEQVVYKVQFRQNYIYAVGTSFMRVYDYKGSELTDKRKTVYGYTLEAVNEDTENPLMVFIPNSENNKSGYMQDMRVILGDTDSVLHFPLKCISIKAKGSTIYGFSEKALAIANNGKVNSKTYQLPVQIDGVIGVTDDRTAVTTYGSSIYLFKLPQ